MSANRSRRALSTAGRKESHLIVCVQSKRPDSVPDALRYARLSPGSFGFADPSPGLAQLKNRLRIYGVEITSPHHTGNTAGRESATQCGAICR